MKIGIPGGLLYYCYYPLWKTFFESLGAEVVSGSNTNKSILDDGVKLCVDEACLPVKIYHGHVRHLSDKVDALFIPRIMSISKNEYICPKFCGLPDMIRHSVPDIPAVIDTTINFRKSARTLFDSIMDAASLITKDRKRVMEAYKRALIHQTRFDNSMKECGDFNCSISGCKKKYYKNSRRIGIIGHPYNIHDDFANMGICKRLEDEGYSLIIPEMIDEDKINRNAAKMPKRHFWTFGRKVLGAGLSFIEDGNVDGIIYISSFGCGIDSLMEDYLERHIKRDGRIPYMKIVLDEHSGEAGINTRLEAFVDMVRWREEHESNISTHGRHLCGSKRFS